ncbi:hypothetical protein HY950_03675 [Candidatus Gottesmanbacteria bacterium]|nr:hypothetical protein [Candidatus Gottesmanbacteria bacterium]
MFAVPGPITSPYSKGPFKLLKNGAKLVESVEDIIDELRLPKQGDPLKATPFEAKGETKEEEKILALLSDRQRHIDEIVRESGLTIASVAATLTLLEMKGVVKDYGEKEYGIT